MGCGGSKAITSEKSHSDPTPASPKAASKTKKKNEPLKLLLLGAPQTGKSTFLKQLQINFQEGFTDDHREEILESLRNNLIVGFRDIIEFAEKESAEKLDVEARSESHNSHESSSEMKTKGTLRSNTVFSSNSKEAIAYLKDVAMSKKEIEADLVTHAKRLWSDKAMQALWERKDTIPTLLVMNLDYIMDNIDRLAADNVKITDEDILRSRQRTMQSETIKFEFKGYNIEVTDVGGQKTSRRRWSQVVQNPTAIVFFAALSDYNIRSFDGEGTKFQETIEIWKNVVESETFSKAVLVLMLNKYDLFVEKLKRVPFKKAYKKYTGGEEPKEVAEYLKERFLRHVPDDRQANFMANITCALDTTQMKTVFSTIQENITNRVLANAFA